jgi:hypothetical protein
MITQSSAVPLAGPPGAIGLIVFELSTEADGDENFVDGALYRDSGDQS